MKHQNFDPSTSPFLLVFFLPKRLFFSVSALFDCPFFFDVVVVDDDDRDDGTGELVPRYDAFLSFFFVFFFFLLLLLLLSSSSAPPPMVRYTPRRGGLAPGWSRTVRFAVAGAITRL